MAIRNNPFRPLLKRIPQPLRNKYVLVLLFVIPWMLFFTRHNFWSQFKLQQRLNTLEEEQQYYRDKIKDTEASLEDMNKDKEKFARENYYLQKDDEDVFIIVDEKENTNQ